MLTEIFSDYFAHKKNFLTNIDARIKIALILLIILINLATQQIVFSITITLLILFALLSLKIPLKIILLRLVSPLGIALTVLFIQMFFYGETPLFKLNLFGLNVIGFKEGLDRGFFIMARIIAAVSLILLLSMTTPVNKLFKALGWFKVPLVWIEIGLLTYRYIFVLLEDVLTIKDAQKVRLGYSNCKLTKASIGVLGGSIFIRAYDQAINTFQAMFLRGYGGLKDDSSQKS